MLPLLLRACGVNMEHCPFNGGKDQATPGSMRSYSGRE